MILKKIKFFSKHPPIFSKNPKFWTIWEILLFQSHSTANLLQFGEKEFSRSETWTNIVNAIGKNWIKKRPFWEEDFAFHILNSMAQINIEDT